MNPKIEKYIHMNQCTFICFWLVLVATLSSCRGHEEKLAEDTRPTIKVKVAQPQMLSGITAIEVSGTIQSNELVQVSPRTMGYLIDLKLEVGDRVRRGQTIARISNDDLQARRSQVEANINQAEIQLANVKKDYTRIKTLHEKESATEKELDDITTQYRIAQEEVTKAKQKLAEVEATLAYTRLRAPFSGIVTEKHLQSGDLVSPGRPVLSLESEGAYQAVVNVPENQIVHLQEGQPAQVVIKANQTTLAGTVGPISRSARSTGGQYTAKIDLEPAGLQKQNLYSGMFVSAYIQPDSAEAPAYRQLTIEKSAIHERGQLHGVYVATSDQVALLRWIRLGQDLGERVEVLSGLKPEEQYIVKAEGRLINGARLQIQ